MGQDIPRNYKALKGKCAFCGEKITKTDRSFWGFCDKACAANYKYMKRYPPSQQEMIRRRLLAEFKPEVLKK